MKNEEYCLLSKEKIFGRRKGILAGNFQWEHSRGYEELQRKGGVISKEEDFVIN